MKIYLLILSIFCTTLLAAQNKWTVGVTTGIGYSGWHTNHDCSGLQAGRKLGGRFAPAFNGGVYLAKPLAERITFRTGLNYQNSAGRWVQKQDGTNISKSTYRLHQLQLPLLLQMNFNKNTKGLFLNLGIIPNYIIDGQLISYHYNSSPDTKERSELPLDFSTQTNQPLRFFVQPTIGLGYALSDRWTVATNFTWGASMNYDVGAIDFYYCFLRHSLYNRRSFLVQMNYQLSR